MNTHNPRLKGLGHHPLMLLAALAVLLFCLVGTAAIMGWLPPSHGGTADRQLSDADRMALAAGMQQAAPPAAPLPQQAAAQPVQSPYPARQVQPPYPVQSYQQGALPSAAAPAPAPAKPVQLAAQEQPGSNWCANCGNVESVRSITHRARGSGLGAAGGAVLGGLLGTQIGSGNGRQLATVAGAVGGAVVGNQVEGNMKATTTYEIRVRLDDGTLRTFHQSSPASWRNGARVRIVKGKLRPA